MKLPFTVAIAVGLLAGRVLANPPATSSAPADLHTRRSIRGTNGTAPELSGIDFNPDVFASDAQWRQYVDKGLQLTCLMEATDQGAGYLLDDSRSPPSAASRWAGDLKNDLAKWYWHITDWDEGWECDWRRQGLTEAFEGQGLNPDPAFDDEGHPSGGNNQCINVSHYDENDLVDPRDENSPTKQFRDQHYWVDGRKYTSTGAYYHFAMNKIDGAIIAKNLGNPATSVFGAWHRQAAPGELPELRFVSDIFWGFWVRDNPNVKNIQVYGAYLVINERTVLLVSRALRNVHVNTLKLWPGTSFSAETEEGKALIGSPIGATIAHMLLSHKAELGIKHITKVTICTGDNPFKEMHIFFTIADVKDDKGSRVERRDSQHQEKDVSSDEDSEDQVLYMKSTNRVREHIVAFQDLSHNDG